jgi:hypothetical protein
MRRIEKLITVIIISASIFCSCKPGTPGNELIPVKELVNVLTELYVADGLLAYPPVRNMFSLKDSTANYLDVIKKFGYTKEQMDRTMLYYFDKKPKKLENIYDQVLTRLSEKQTLLNITEPPKVLQSANLWTGPQLYSVPESGINDPAMFNIPLKDTGNYILEFTIAVFPDDQSLNPKVTLYFYYPDTSKNGYRDYWTAVPLLKDGVRHTYTLTRNNSNPAVTHLSGSFFDCDPKEGRWEKHALVDNIILRKGTVE